MLPWGDALRPGWLPRLHEVVGTPRFSDGIRHWITEQSFQVYTPPTVGGFVVNYIDELLVGDAYAAEVSRFSVAAAETSCTMADVTRLPSSRAWQLIQWYYAAYYAAHALLRMFGLSLSYIEKGHAQVVDEVSQAYGHPAGVVGAGLYAVAPAPVNSSLGGGLEFRKITSSKGSHDELWCMFAKFVDSQSSGVLANARLPRGEAQQISTELNALAAVLRRSPNRTGTWLARVRNEVTYKHTQSVWYPWKADAVLPSLRELRPEQMVDVSDQISRLIAATSDLQRFRYACYAIVSLCRVSCREMNERCPSGRRKSFQTRALAALDCIVAGR